MIQRPWDCAQPDEWLPQSLRLCWGGDSGGGSGMGGSDGGGGWDGSGGGMGNTGGGDWGSAGMYDASGFNAGGDLGAWAGSAYDASSFPSGTLGGGDWGSFGTTNYGGMDAPNPTFADIAGPNPGVTTGGGDWGSAGAFSAAGLGGGPGGSLYGAAQGAASGFWGGGDTGGGFSGYGGGGGGGGTYGGSGGGYTGGGGQQGGGSFGSFGTGALGGSNAIAAAPTGPAGSTFADSYGGGSLSGPAGQASSGAPTTSEAQSESAGGGETTSDSDAAPTDDAAPAQSDFGTPTATEAAPEAEAGPSLSDAAPAGMIGGSQDAAPTSAGGTVAPAQAETSQPSAFGPQSLNADYQGAPYADMGPEASSQAYNEGMQALSDLTQSALSGGPDYQGAPYADMGPQGEQQDSFDSRFAVDPNTDTTNWGALFEGAAPSQDITENFPASQNIENREAEVFDRSDLMAQVVDFLQTFPGTGYWGRAAESGGPMGRELGEEDIGKEPAQPFDAPAQQQDTTNWDALFEGAAPADVLSGWNPAEQMAGRAGLAEPTDWGGNPLAASTDVSVGRDFNQAFDPFGDTPTGMDLAGDRATAEGAINPNSLFQAGWAPTNVYQEGRGADYGSGRAAQDYVTTAVSALPMFAASPAILSTISALTGISVPGLLGGGAITGGTLGGLMNADTGKTPAPPQQQVTEVELVSPQDVPAPPPPPPQEVQPTEVAPVAPTEAAPAVAPSEAAPPEAAPAAPPQAPQEAEQAQPQEAEPAPPSLVDMVTAPPPSQAPPAQQPGLVTMLPPPVLTPQVQPTETPAAPPAPPAAPADEHDDAPEPQDTSQPPQDPNAPRPAENIPGQVTGARGNYTNDRMDNPQTNRNYRDSGRTDYPQGRPGITFRTARQAGIEPLFRIEDINVRDVDARLVENINRALRDMEQRTGIPANSLVATSGWRPAHRGEAHEHGQDERTSQESVYSRYNPNGRNIGPAAQPGRSNHGPGRALDFAASPARDWLRRHAGEYGLETLGRNFDLPHIQLQRGQGGQRPSAQEQADQRALDAQNRQLAIDRGLIAPGRGNQQAGVPTPRARPSDAPQPEVAQPRPPADIPPAALPPQAPQETRPPADIPAPTLTPPRAGRADPVLLARTASQIAKDMAAKGPRPTSLAEGTAAAVALARSLAQAGIPANIANQIVTNVVREGTRQAGYDPDGMLASSSVKGVIATALQGYQPAWPGEVQGPGAPEASLRGLAKGGHVAKDEPVVVGEEGPETFVPDTAGTVFPHQPQPGKTGKSENLDRWPKIPAPQFPGRYGGVEREMLRQTREAQNPVPSLIDLIDSGRLPLNAARWHQMMNDPSLIALGRSRFEDRREGIDPGAEQYGAFIPAPAPAAEPPDPSSPMAQALGYGSIKRRPMQIGRQSYSQ